MNSKSDKYPTMNLHNGQLQPEFEANYYEPVETDIRREPNYVFYLLMILVGLFTIAMVTLFVTNGHLPFFE
jgi:hypothetical protein